MDVVLRVAADLPDAGVGFPPLPRDVIREPDHGPPRLGVQATAGLREQPRRVEHPAVVVELMLVGGAVADPDRAAVGVSGPVVERALGTRMLAVQRQQHGKARSVEATGVQEPAEEHAGFACLADAEERPDADAGVARPREAVVPVADPAERLGQRRGRRRDRRTRRRVREQPQGDEAADDGVTERDVGVDRLRPAPPPLAVGFERAPRGLRVDVDQRLAVRDREHQDQRPARLDRDRHRPSGHDRQVGSRVAGRPRARPRCRRARSAVARRAARGALRRSADRTRSSPGPRRRSRRAGGRACSRAGAGRAVRPTMPSVRVRRAPSRSQLVSRSRCRVGSDGWPARRASSGPARKWPAAGPPTRRPNSGSPSKCGTHIQSIDPSDDTSAAVRVSPISP